MGLFPIYALLVYGIPIAVLALINLACVPLWRVTLRDILIFVLGGFLGMFVLVNLVIWIMQGLWTYWRIGIQEPQTSQIVEYVLFAIGAELGGAGLTYLRYRQRKG